MAEGGESTGVEDKWIPPVSTNSQPRKKDSPQTYHVDSVWTTGRVCIRKPRNDELYIFVLRDEVYYGQYLFKHRKGYLDAHGWEFGHYKGLPCISISTDKVRECEQAVHQWISDQRNVLKARKLELFSDDINDSLQRFLSSLMPAIQNTDGEVDVFYDKAMDCLYIVGFKKSVDEIFKDAKADMKNYELSIVESIIDLQSELHGDVLRSFHIFDKLNQDFPKVDIHLQDCNKKVKCRGRANEIEKCRNKVVEFLRGLKTERFDMPPSPTKLLLKPVTKSYINSLLEEDNISCALGVSREGKLQLVYQQASDLKVAHCKIKENIKVFAFSASQFTRFMEMSSRLLGLSQKQFERLIIEETTEGVNVLATSDVSKDITKWIQSSACGSQMQHAAVQMEIPPQASNKKKERLAVTDFELCLWIDLRLADVCSKVPERHYTTENGYIVIEALEEDIKHIQEDIKGVLHRIEKDKAACSLQKDCGGLLKNQKAKDYVSNKLKRNEHRCVWKLGTELTVYVYALTVQEASAAAHSIGGMVSVRSLSADFQRVQELLNEDACKEVLEKYQGKAKMLSASDEFPLVATTDAMEEIIQVFKASDKKINTEMSVSLELSDGICAFLLENQSSFFKQAQEMYGVRLISSEDKRQLKLLGHEKDVRAIKSALESRISDITSKSQSMNFLPELLSDERQKQQFQMLNHCNLSMEKAKIPRKPCPSNTWVLNNSNYLMLVQGSIAETNHTMYAVVCPVDGNMRPIGAGQAIMAHGGNSLKNDIQHNSSHGQSSSTGKSDPWTYFSDETGNLDCQSIIYTVFPSQKEKGSQMSVSKSVVAARVKETLELADSKELFSLAIPFELSDVIPVANCIQAVAECLLKSVGTLKHLKEIYLYCNEKDLGVTRVIFSQVLPPERHWNLDFSKLIKDQEKDKKHSPIQMEIVKGSLTDQKVDVLVNTTNQRLDLDIGFVSKTILKMGGNRIQRECNTTYKDGICIGDVAVTSAGKFQRVRNIFHVVLPSWKPTGNLSLMVLELLMTKCLIEADKRMMQSIAFPVLGTGKLLYPVHLVIKTMFDTVMKYGTSKKTNIKVVKFSIFEDDILKAFKIYEEHRGFGAARTDDKEPPCSILEARVPTKGTSVQIQVLLFRRCAWRVHALVEFVTAAECISDPQYQELTATGYTSKWLTKGSQHYLSIRALFDFDDKITKIIQRALKDSCEGRVTSVGFVAKTLECQKSKRKLTCKDLAKLVKKSVKEFNGDNMYLQEIKILVMAEEDFYMFLAEKKSKRNTGTRKEFKLFGKKKCPWKVVRYMKQSDLRFKVTLVADKNNVEKAFESFLSETAKQDNTGHHFVNENGHLTERTVQGATGGYTSYQTDTGHPAESSGEGATGGVIGYQNDTGRSAERRVHPTKGSHYDFENDMGFSGNRTSHVNSSSENHLLLNNKHAKPHTLHGPNSSPGYQLDTGQRRDLDKTMLHSQESHRSVPSEQLPLQKDQHPPVQDIDVFETLVAGVNPGISSHASEWKTELKSLHCDVNKDQIVCKSLPSLEKVDKALQIKFCSDPLLVNCIDDHFNNSQDHGVYVESIDMSEETFLAVKHFSAKDYFSDQISYKNGKLRVSCTDKTITKAVKTSIESKMKHIEIMNKDDFSFSADEETKISRIITDIHQNVDAVFCYQLEEDKRRQVHLMALNYSDLQAAKHKFSLGLGRIKQTETRRNRRFDNSSLQQGTPSERDRFRHSYHGSRSAGKSNSATGYSSVSSVDFKTAEGLLVQVYSGSILHLDVDCIVNAANGDLQHGGGVAQVISSAAGYEFDRESRDYIARYGPLGVGNVCTTTAGNLKYKGVVHAVGPRWYDYSHDQKWLCLKDLQSTVQNSLDEADIQGYKSIAIPAISSGIFGVPKELCSQQYYRAVEEYSRTRGHDSSLTEVHFIDKDTEMCQLIQTTFTKCFGKSDSYKSDNGDRKKSPTSTIHHTKPPSVILRSRSVPSDTDGSPVDSPSLLSFTEQHSKPGVKDFKYQIGNNLTVHIVHGNIVELKTDAIVSPENVQCDSTGRIAREIARVAGQKYVDNERYELTLEQRKPKLTEVRDTLAGDSHFKYVLHVVAPKWNVEAVQDQSKFWKQLDQSYSNIFSLWDKNCPDVASLALPILGTGKVPKLPVPIISISKQIADVCKMYADKTTTRKTLYVCSDDIVAVRSLRDIFDKKFIKSDEESMADRKDQTADQRGQTTPDVSGHPQGAVKEVVEDCCICIDTITKPKKLSCGHAFCTDCIDQQFKYKPACPQCGAVHGKIMGDQPTGTMTTQTMKSYGSQKSLPGYSGCGVINIIYSFPSGIQGPDHPTPGKHYQGITRCAYLPDNEKGRLVAKLLKIAFDRKLVFTIGRSRTSGYDGVVTWNDVHHKTRKEGGPQAFAYPDPTYLDRVLDELKVKGVTEESLHE
ncbi:uncharacterized protein LOC132559570 [Ylistrum balloti]|uniref:uncharacterized protein LOC132559570 n=1 Tax=Ylistrum balloti TaxID=509963 RepID=UPI002905B05A|nr:uncharacterized protein LOC132559570 [Ylistrum balloti]